MADAYVGWQVLAAVLQALRSSPDLVGVQIEAGWPGDTARAEAIYAGEITADIDTPVMTAGPKYRDQVLTIPLEVRVASRGSLDATRERLSFLLGAVEEIVASDTTLGNLPAVVEVTAPSIREMAGIQTQTPLGMGLITLEVHTRIQPA